MQLGELVGGAVGEIPRCQHLGTRPPAAGVVPVPLRTAALAPWPRRIPRATPAAAAQVAVDSLVASGVSSILNFAPTVVTVPDRVDLRQVDLATELQILGYHQHHRAVAGRADRATG